MAFIAKIDFKIGILEDELNQIVRNDDTLIDQAIAAAIDEMKAYLYDSFDVDAIFGATGTARNQLLVKYAVDIAVWSLVATVQAGQDIDERKARYDRAIAWLRMVKKTKIYSDLPRRTETVQDHIVIGSSSKRNNYY